MVHVGIAGGLLRRHVGGRAQGHAERGERGGAARARDRLGDAEVRHERVLPREQHVVGLHIAVHDAVPVSVGERSEEHTSELQSRLHLVCRLLLEKKKTSYRERTWASTCARTLITVTS